MGTPRRGHQGELLIPSVVIPSGAFSGRKMIRRVLSLQMAQGLGLSRLGAEQQSVEGKPLPMWTGRWESLIQREVGRRIWWNLVFLDWALAPSYNFSCSIHPDQSRSRLPRHSGPVPLSLHSHIDALTRPQSRPPCRPTSRTRTSQTTSR